MACEIADAQHHVVDPPQLEGRFVHWSARGTGSRWYGDDPQLTHLSPRGRGRRACAAGEGVGGAACPQIAVFGWIHEPACPYAKEISQPTASRLRRLPSSALRVPSPTRGEGLPTGYNPPQHAVEEAGQPLRAWPAAEGATPVIAQARDRRVHTLWRDRPRMAGAEGARSAIHAARRHALPNSQAKGQRGAPACGFARAVLMDLASMGAYRTPHVHAPDQLAFPARPRTP